MRLVCVCPSQVIPRKLLVIIVKLGMHGDFPRHENASRVNYIDLDLHSSRKYLTCYNGWPFLCHLDFENFCVAWPACFYCVGNWNSLQKFILLVFKSANGLFHFGSSFSENLWDLKYINIIENWRIIWGIC